jgi:hypothetical protein
MSGCVTSLRGERCHAGTDNEAMRVVLTPEVIWGYAYDAYGNAGNVLFFIE